MDDIHDIKIPIETPFLIPSLLHWIILLVSIFFLLVFVLVIYYFLFKKKKVKKIKIAIKPQIDYQKIINIQLKKTKEYLDQGDYKTFNLKISKVIKSYLDYKYKSNFSDLTTKEILANNKLPTKKINKLENLLKTVDLSKYANQQFAQEKNREIYDSVVLFFKE